MRLLSFNDQPCRRVHRGDRDYDSARIQNYVRYDLGSLTIDELEEIIGKPKYEKLNQLCISLSVVVCPNYREEQL